ncbi:hypothetical protein HDU93_003190, partial [Gonapodya sp. JEL0774]
QITFNKESLRDQPVYVSQEVVALQAEELELGECGQAGRELGSEVVVGSVEEGEAGDVDDGGDGTDECVVVECDRGE